MTPSWSNELGDYPVNFTVGSLVVALGVLAVRGAAEAQVAPPESARGLFGSGPRAAAKTLLDFDVTLNEGYDRDELRGPVSTTVPIVPTGPTIPISAGGFSTLLRTGAVYEHRAKAQVAARANAVLRYYSDIGQVQSVGHNAGIGLTTTTVGGLTVLLNQSAAYSPASFYGLFPIETPVAAGDPGITSPNYTVGNNFQAYMYTTSMSLTHDIGRRSYVTATGEFFYTDRLHETPTWSDISSYSLRGRYSRNTARNIALSTEFRYRSGEYGYRGGGATTELALDVGVDYRRPVSATRRVSLDAHVGLSGANYPATEIGLTGFRRQRRVVGDGGFSIPLSHTWFVTTSVRRGLEYETSLPTPVVNNAARVSVTGLVTNRVEVVFSAGYARGESVFNQATLSYDTYTGEVGVRYAMSRNLALNGGYLYYNYNMHNVLLLPGVPPGLIRNGVRAGLTLWTPALRR